MMTFLAFFFFVCTSFSFSIFQFFYLFLVFCFVHPIFQFSPFSKKNFFFFSCMYFNFVCYNFSTSFLRAFDHTRVTDFFIRLFFASSHGKIHPVFRKIKFFYNQKIKFFLQSKKNGIKKLWQNNIFIFISLPFY